MLTALIGTFVLFSVGWLATGRRRDALIPAAFLGGLLGLALRQFDLLPGTVEDWQQIGYHLFGISFLAIGLTRSERNEKPTGGAVWIGVGQGFSFALQAAVGGAVTLALATRYDLFSVFGFLAPMGLEEGPGQAVSIGSVWEAAGFTNAATLGATIASIGFVAAYGLGLASLRLRGRHLDRGSARTTRIDTTVPAKSWVPTGVVVVVTYTALYLGVRASTGLIGPGVRDTVLGVLFFIALLVGLGLRAAASKFGYTVEPGPQQKITVVAVDGLTVAILASLAWTRIASDAVPLAILVGATLTATAAGVWFASRQIDNHRFDRALALWGTVTGTVSSGLALISLADPDGDTPVAVELGSSVVVSAPLVVGGIAVATATAQSALTLTVATVGFAVTTVITGAVLVWAGRHFESL